MKTSWIDSVRSTANQMAKVAASASVKPMVESISGMPKASVMLSVISVPTTEISTTAIQ